MNLNLAQVAAIGRHVLTAASTVLATLVFLHFISDGDASGISAALKQIGDGVTSIIAGLTALIPILSALYASKSATLHAQIAAVASSPDVKQVVAAPAVANAADNSKVVSK